MQKSAENVHIIWLVLLSVSALLLGSDLNWNLCNFVARTLKSSFLLCLCRDCLSALHIPDADVVIILYVVYGMTLSKAEHPERVGYTDFTSGLRSGSEFISTQGLSYSSPVKE